MQLSNHLKFIKEFIKEIKNIKADKRQKLENSIYKITKKVL